MKTKTLAPLLSLSVLATVLNAAPLTGTTAVQTKPDPKAPAITYLKAGTEPMPASSFLGSVPTGWMAVELPGPFEGYVTNNDVSKNLDIIPGAQIHTEPKAESTVLTSMEKGDTASITGIPKGKWIQIQVQKKIIGYINLTPTPTTVSLPSATSGSANIVGAATPVAVSSSVTAPGRAVQSVDSGDGGSAALPRQFQGKFVSTRRPLAPKRPYDYQLNDNAGVRVGYVDISKLLQTEQIDKYVDRTVVVYGTAKNDADAKAVVIRAESLQLK